MARAAPSLDPLAGVIQRLSVLLAAGVAPASGWSYLAEAASGSVAPLLREVAGSVASGTPIAEAVVVASAAAPADEAPAWRGLAAAWQVATEAGASLAPSLRDFAGSLRSLAQNQRDLQTALAAPAATARMVMVLPLVGLLFGFALGFDPFGTLFGTVPGAVCLVLGVVLMLLARWWNRRLLAGARPTVITPGLALDLMAIAVSGGASLDRALASVAEAGERCGLDRGDSQEAIAEVLGLSRRAGVPAAALLRSEAEEARRVARSAAERKAATLSVTLMLPLGLCILPAFMLLGVAPLLISVISSTVSAF